ncbi:hypothetical protein VTK56DRAFT_4348 [Thermocarpiscus australiensis]
MALAYLCSKIRRADHWFKVADHPVSSAFAIIVDHGLREGSDVEAQNVVKVVRQLGVKTHVLKIRWEEVIGKGVNPNHLPNVETLARQLRYRRLGMLCKTWQAPSLLTAHHEDDQYETVLMRLLSGHGYRGLQGMRPANDIPECYDLHGVYQSGFVDDQRQENPLYNMRPTDRQRRYLKSGLRHEVDPEVIAMEIEGGLRADIAGTYLDEYDGIARGSKRAPPLVPLEVEDGGIMVYRPLLRFSKDRLVATCLENGVPWFEDHTNTDQTLTMRNAVRYMYKNNELPAALQKPAILRLAERCRRRVALEEAETERLLDRVVIHDFGSNAGTVVVTLPRFSLPSVPRRSSRSRAGRRRRIGHYRHIAALLIRRLLSMVTPERELSPVAQLGHVVSMLFPSLAEDTPPPEPKPYVICGVHFIPLIGDYPLRWLLARAPYASNAPRPSLAFHHLPLGKRIQKHPRDWKVKGWSDCRIYDGRYWIRLLHRLPCKVRIAPFEMEHHKPFREALADDQARNELSLMLRRYAPGKVRYALPAIYATIDVSDLLAGGDWWPADQPPSSSEPSTDAIEEAEDLTKSVRGSSLSKLYASRLEWERELKRHEKLHLLALPTLGVALPGLDEWLRWDIRYRKVDHELLQLSKLGSSRLGQRGFRSRVKALYLQTRLRQQKGASRLRR